MPASEDETSTYLHIKWIQGELTKTGSNIDMNNVNRKIALTFAQRRHAIVVERIRVKELVDLYPWLLSRQEVYCYVNNTVLVHFLCLNLVHILCINLAFDWLKSCIKFRVLTCNVPLLSLFFIFENTLVYPVCTVYVGSINMTSCFSMLCCKDFLEILVDVKFCAQKV